MKLASHRPTAPRSAPNGGACPVCGFAAMRTDLVLDRTWILLSECPRCAHRTTGSLAVAAGHPVRAELRKTPAAA